MGTAHGRIRIDYEGDGFEQADRGLQRVSQGADDSSSRMAGLAKTIGNLTTMLAAFGPAAAQMAAAGVAAAGTLGAAFIAAGASVGAFQAAVKPQFAAITEVGALYDDAMKSIMAGSDDAKEKVKAYKEALAQLPPATQQTAVAFFGLKNQFKAWSDSLASTTMPVFTRGIMVLRSLLPLLTPLVKVAAKAFGDMMTEIEQGVKGGGVARFAAMLTTAASTALPAFLRSARNIAVGLGGILKAFLPMSNTMTGGIESLTAKFAAWGQSLGGSSGFGAFMENMRTQGPLIGKLLTDLATIVGNLIIAFAPFIGATTQIAVALAALVANIPTPVLSALIGIITTLTIAMKVWAATQLIITAATKAWAAAQAIMNAVMWANPLGLILLAIIAVIAIIVLIATKTDWFSKLWDKVWNGIKAVTSAVVGFIVNFVRNHWRLLLAILLGPFGLMIGQITKHWNTIKNVFMSAVNTVVGFVRKNWRLILVLISGPIGLAVALVTKYWNQIWGAISRIGNAIANFVRGMISRVLGHIRQIVGIVGIVSSAFNRFNSAIVSRASSAIRSVARIRDSILGIFRNAGSWLYNAGVNIIRGLINGIVSMFNSLRNTLNSVTRALPDWKGPPSTDRRLLIDNGRLIMSGLIRGFEDYIPRVQASLSGMTRLIQTQTAAQLPPVVFGSDAASPAPVPTAPFSGAASLPEDFTTRLIEGLQRAGVGAVYLDGQVVSDVVGKIQGRATSLKRRTR